MNKSNLYKLKAIIAREFFVKVRNKGFLIGTLLVPIGMIVIVAFVLWIAITQIGKEKIAVIDPTHEYLSLFEDTQSYQFVSTTKTLEDFKKEGEENDEQVTAILNIKGDLLQNPKAIELYSYKTASPDLSKFIESKLSTYLTNKKLEHSGVDNIQQIINDSRVTISLSATSYKLEKSGDIKHSSGSTAGMIGYGLSMFSFFFISFFGMMVMNAVMEEKKSRIMEVMVSSIKPFYLMLGKIIGTALVGVLQIAIWVVFAFILYFIASVISFGAIVSVNALTDLSQMNVGGLMANMDADNIRNIQEIASVLADIHWINLIFMTVVYFVGGYMLYASLFAAVGSAFTEQEEGNMLITPIMLILSIAFYGGIASIRNPEGPVAVWLSMIPFTSPVNMLVRIPYGVPIWQQIISVLLLFITVLLTIWLAAKIYRVGILMHGKKPSIKEIARWISYR